MKRACSLTFVVISVLLLICQQCQTQGNVCQILHTFLLLNTTEGVAFTYQSSLSKDPQTITFPGEYIPDECGPNFQRCNITIVEQNQRTVAVTPLIRGVGLLSYNHSTNVLQFFEKYVLPIPESWQCRMTSMYKLRTGRLLAHCLNLRAENKNIKHFELSVNFTNIASSVWYESHERYHPEKLYAPDSFSGFVYAPDTSCASGDPYHIYSVDDGYVLDFRKEYTSYTFTYNPYCINHQGCQLVTKLAYVTRERLAVYCAGGVTILYSTCSTPTITESRSDHCSVDQLSLKEVAVFDTLVNGTPYFCSPDTYVLHKNNILTLVQNEDSNRTIPLLTLPTDPVIDASCSNLNNEIFFLSFHQSGETYLTRVNENATTLIGRSVLEHNIPPKIYHQRYTAVNNGSASLVVDFNCVEPRVQVDRPYHLAVVVEAKATQKCECGAGETTEVTELPTNGTNATTEISDPTSEATSEATRGTPMSTGTTSKAPSSTDTNNETFSSMDATTKAPSNTAETTSSMDATTEFLASLPNTTIDIAVQELVVVATVSSSVSFIILLILIVTVIAVVSAHLCRRKLGRTRVRLQDSSSVGTQEVEMAEVGQAAGSASSTPESSPQPDNRGGTITVELSSPQPNNAPPSTLDTTGGNTQGAQPHTAGGANVLNQPAQGPRDAQPHPAGGADVLNQPAQEPGDAQPHPAGGADVLNQPAQGPGDAQPHPAGGADVLNQPAQEPRDAQPHPAGGANVLDQPAQEPGDAQPHPAGGADVLNQPAQEPGDAQPHPAGGANVLNQPAQEPRDAQPHPAGGANVLDQPGQEPGDAQPHPAGGANVLDQPAQEPGDAQPHPAGGATRLELPLQDHDTLLFPRLATLESPTDEAVPCTVNDQGTPSSDLVTGLMPPLSLSQTQRGRDLDNNNQPR